MTKRKSPPGMKQLNAILDNAEIQAHGDPEFAVFLLMSAAACLCEDKATFMAEAVDMARMAWKPVKKGKGATILTFQQAKERQ